MTFYLPPGEKDPLLVAEESLCGAIMLDAGATGILETVRATLSPEDFYYRYTRRIYETLLQLGDEGLTPEAITCAQRLRGEPGLPFSYVAGLSQQVPSVSLTDSWVRQVNEYAGRRQAEQLLQRRLHSLSHEDEQSFESQLLSLERDIEGILTRKSISAEAKRACDISADVYERIAAAYASEDSFSGMGTGIYEVDEITGGLHGGQMWIIAGRPSMGKTSYSLSVALYVALVLRLPVFIWSGEMSRSEVMEFMLAQYGRINLLEMKNGNLSREDMETRIPALLADFDAAPIYIDDTPGQQIEGIQQSAEKVRRKENGQMGLVIVDYLQLIEQESSQRIRNRTEDVGQVSRACKLMAKRLDAPVIALSQLNREVEKRNNKRPVTSDLRESGSLEQDADKITFIYRDEHYHEDTPEPGVAEIIFNKQRGGPSGTVKVSFIGEYTRFESLYYLSPIYQVQSAPLPDNPPAQDHPADSGRPSNTAEMPAAQEDTHDTPEWLETEVDSSIFEQSEV